jgi:hypothetical protein
MAMHPIAMKDDYSDTEHRGPWDSFIGEDTSEGVTHTWGPGIGWFIILIGFIFALLVLIVAFRILKFDISKQDSPIFHPPPQEAQQQHLCQACQQPLTYVEQYQRWYCDNCRRYQ